MQHPDEYWQSSEPAYKKVFSDVQDVWLPWEFWDGYHLRSQLYPMYLSIPMYILRYLGLDTNLLIRKSPYLMQIVLVIIADYFFWKTLKRILVRDAARLSFLLYFVNKCQTIYMIRTLTNSIEAIFTIICFYIYLDQKDTFTMKTVLLTTFLTVSMMIRTTSPTSWIALLGYKVLFEGSLKPFLIAGVFVFLPVVLVCIAIDTYMYGAKEWVVTGYNFYLINIEKGLSATFGLNDFWYYWRIILPINLLFLTPLVLFGLLRHCKAQKERGQVPYLFVFALFYIFFFSCIGHKEERFLLPVFCYMLMFGGEYAHHAMQKSGRCWAKFCAWLCKFSIITELALLHNWDTFYRHNYESRVDLANMEPRPHSVFMC